MPGRRKERSREAKRSDEADWTSSTITHHDLSATVRLCQTRQPPPTMAAYERTEHEKKYDRQMR
jgi:hypothetical protein